MNKYIPADKLIAEIERLAGLLPKEQGVSINLDWARNILVALRQFITSLQQEQPDVQNGKFVFPKYLYARTKDNKTIDMSYAPQDMTAIEYVRNDFVQQELSEADLDKLVNEEFASHSRTTEYGLEATYNRDDLYRLIKRLSLVFNARKEK